MQLIKNIIWKSWSDAGKRSMQRQFSWLISLVPIFMAVFQSGNENLVFLILAASIILLTGYLLPKIYRPFLFIWLFAGRILGEITSFVILGICYFTAGSLYAFFRRNRENHGWHPKESRNDYEQM